MTGKKMLTAALPHLGIVAAHGDTPQALAEDVADQLRFVLRHYAQADDASLTPDAQALARRLREWLADAPVVVMRSGRIDAAEVARVTQAGGVVHVVGDDGRVKIVLTCPVDRDD